MVQKKETKEQVLLAIVRSISEQGYVVVSTDKYRRNGWRLTKDSTNGLLVQLWEADFLGAEEANARMIGCSSYDAGVKTYGFAVRGYDYSFQVNVNA